MKSLWRFIQFAWGRLFHSRKSIFNWFNNWYSSKQLFTANEHSLSPQQVWNCRLKSLRPPGRIFVFDLSLSLSILLLLTLSNRQSILPHQATVLLQIRSTVLLYYCVGDSKLLSHNKSDKQQPTSSSGHSLNLRLDYFVGHEALLLQIVVVVVVAASSCGSCRTSDNSNPDRLRRKTQTLQIR